MKYTINQCHYIKKDGKGLCQDEMVVIVSVRKKGRKTYVDVQRITGAIVNDVSVKRLRKRPRCL